MELRVYVTETQLAQIKIGQKVTVAIDSENDTKKYEGHINWISAQAEFTPKVIQTKEERANLVYAVKVAVKNDGSLKIGNFGRSLAKIIINQYRKNHEKFKFKNVVF